MEKYRITNTTVKPPRVGPSGKDTRTTIERVGHFVQWRDEQDRMISFPVGSPKFVNKVDGGLMGLARGGYIKIEKIGDVTEVLEEHAYPVRPKAAPAKTAKRASAVQMGLDTHESKGGAEYEGAVNPDGDPNFLVTAGAAGKRKRRARNGNAANTGVQASVGEGEEVS
jgi:hypothetical protein